MAKGDHKRALQLARDIEVQRLARQDFKSAFAAQIESRKEEKEAEAQDSCGTYCVGIDYVDGVFYQMSGHRAVPDKTWDITGGLCWRCAWYAAYRYEDGEWINKDDQEEGS